MNQYQAELYHHGIKGQKWGVRRFQNLDGSYTSLGKNKYSKGKTVLETAKTILSPVAKESPKTPATPKYAKVDGALNLPKPKLTTVKDFADGKNTSMKRLSTKTIKYGKKIVNAHSDKGDLLLNHISSKNKDYGKEALNRILNPNSKKDYPWDEKPRPSQAWDEKIKKPGSGGNI